jgi:hypothetical protein
MGNMYDNIDDHDQTDGQINQEEAWFYHIIGEFQDCIDKYGCAFVLSKLDNNVKQLIKEKINV